MITLIEPQRGKAILESLNHRVSSDPTLFHAVSVSADFFVFTYPAILIAIYMYGYFKKQPSYQFAGLSILLSGIIGIAINLIIQLFVRKDRPETLPGLELILKHVPSISFPSDHAAISMALAVGTFFACKHLKSFHGKQTLVRIGGFILLLFSLIMGLARIAVAVHRPTDILAGWMIGIIGGRSGRALSKSTLGIKCIMNLISRGNNIANHIIPAKFRS